LLDLAAAASATAGSIHGANVAFRRVTTDSRDVRPGDLFVGLRGDRFDGQTFADQALASGAAAVMVSDASLLSTPSANAIVVGDTRIALGQLAAFWRTRFAIPLIAITGSNGKTTVKELLASILRRAAGEAGVLATAGNLNNDIGMPLTLLGLREGHKYAVIEMGMNHLGEIAYLSRIAAPTVALINNAGTAHIGELGSVEAIARAKGEIFEGLGKSGIAIINGDDAFADYWRGLARGRQVVDFGLDRKTTVSARYELAETGSLITVQTPEGQFVTRLNVPGMHNVKNALAASSAAWTLGIDAQVIADGIAAYRGAKGRLQIQRHPSGARVIDDTYNANPESMKAAITVLAACTGRRILVIGDMGELGENAEAMHVGIGEFAKRAAIDALFALGPHSAAAARAFGAQARHFGSIDELVAELVPLLDSQTTVLVKGSRFMHMELVVHALGTVSGEAGSKGGA
jgi:UDP-N-acetylmuramoyl-tripeptide--D-alanyl-D-alanine ligase